MAGSNHIPKEQGYEKNLFYKIALYLEGHLQDSLSVKSIALQFNLSTPTLQQLFIKYGHKSVQHYIGDIRMQRAMKLIIAGGRIKEVMLQTGYRQRSTFYKAFIKKFRFPPGHFRK